MSIKVYKCGTKVKTKLNNIEAIITGKTIRYAAIAYEISYFDNAEYRQIWMNENEFIVTDGKKQSIGFVN